MGGTLLALGARRKRVKLQAAKNRKHLTRPAAGRDRNTTLPVSLVVGIVSYSL